LDEPAKRPDLSPEQQNTAALIRQLLGKSLADRYVDFSRLASGAIPLRISIPVAAHALRELESIVRQTLAGPMEIAIDATPADLKKLKLPGRTCTPSASTRTRSIAPPGNYCRD
jgi:hypothetical protein